MRNQCGVQPALAQNAGSNRQASQGRKFCFSAIALFSSLCAPALFAQNQGGLGDVARQRKAQSRPAPKAGTGQSASQQPDLAWLQDAMKDRELVAELGQLMEKIQKGVSYPAMRNQSQILGRLPESTLFYVALPNYGQTLHQAYELFQQGLTDSPHLRAFLKKNNFDSVQPKIESGVQKFYEVSQFLGDEVVVAGKLEGQEPSGVLVAEVKKPGLRAVLEKINNEVFTKPEDRLRIFDPQQLATAAEGKSHAPAVLVRPDYVAFGLSLAPLREFNAQLDQRGPSFASRALGQRLTSSYRQGTNTLIGVDLHQLIDFIPVTKAQNRAMLEKTGLTDVNYLVMNSTLSANTAQNEGEIVFSGPRRGVASWIAAPAPMGGLDFVPSGTAMAMDVILKKPAMIFDDLQDILGEAAFASVPQMEAQFNLNLKHDLLNKLTGELVLASPGGPDAIAPSTAPTKTSFAPDTAPKSGSFELVLGVSDAEGLQQTLAKLLVMAPGQPGEREEEGVTFHTITLPGAADTSTEINYFFLDGYLVIASERALAEEAVRAHRGGKSMGKSARLRESLSHAPSANASMIIYQNYGQMMAPMMAQLPPEIRQLIPAATMDTPPNVFSVYADESSLRGFSSSEMQTNASVVLIGAAVAIPSLLKSREAANDAAAISGVRTVNTAQAAYSITYPERGFASGLSLLGPGAGGDCSGASPTAEHACLLDGALADPTCTAGKWCPKNGYKFSVRGVCLAGKCAGYVVTATPENAGASGKNYCSTDDAVIRSRAGSSLATPLTAAECKSWAPVR
jgi:hypothetical protein